jgi:hypothetical protein
MRLVAQFDELRKTLEEKQAREISDQDRKLEEALRRRRERKQEVVKDIGVKQQKIVEQIAARTADELIEANFPSDQQPLDEEAVRRAFNRLHSKFNDDEMVQVIENYLDSKNMTELQQLMLALFEERAKSLRKYVFELMTQKQTELEMIREEFRPRFELLKERRQKGLISNDDNYRQQVEKLSKEESDRRMDVEIAIGELEQKAEEDLQLLGIQARARGEEALKVRQTREKQLMIDMLKDKGIGNETVNGYLDKEKRALDRDLERFKREKQKEKAEKLRQLEEMRHRREQELSDKEASMLSWESRVREEEEKHAALFSK